MTTDATSTASLAERARTAFEDSVAAATVELDKAHAAQARLIRQGLTELGFEAAGEDYVNPASGRVCVPLIVGGIATEIHEGEEELVFTRTVAAEWNDDDDAPGIVLVADREPEGNYADRRLYPAGTLRGIADIGVAIEHGGYSKSDLHVSTASNIIDGLIRNARAAAGNTVGYETVAVVHAADAICMALLDVAAAIREKAGS